MRLTVPARHRLLALFAVPLLVLTLGACGGGEPPSPDPGPVPTLDAGPTDRDRLAALAAAAKDRRYLATYLLTGADGPDRTVIAVFATDGTWVVVLPASALSGLADIAIYYSGSALHQCLLGPAAGTSGLRPDLEPLTPACVAVDGLRPAEDPLVHHVFTDWIDAMIARGSALSVDATDLAAVQGSCFSIGSTTASLDPPVDPGVYCYADDGTLTYARASFGTLLLSGGVAEAPPSVALPAPVVDGPPLPVAAPPPAAG